MGRCDRRKMTRMTRASSGRRADSYRIVGRLVRPSSSRTASTTSPRRAYLLYDPRMFSLLMRVTSGYKRDSLAYDALNREPDHPRHLNNHSPHPQTPFSHACNDT